MDEKRLAGVVLPLFSLRRNNDHGIGDLTALRQWIDWAADAHVGFLQLLPVNALGRDENPSPYSAISSVALEPLYLSLEPWTIPGLEERVFNETGDTLPWEQPSGPNLVDYPKVRFWKMWILRGAWNNFKTKPEYEGIMPKFREWVKEQGSWLEDFVCFQVLCDLFGTEIWWHWPEQDPARAKTIAADYEEEKDFARWLQWLCEKQWEFIRIYADERNVKLMGTSPSAFPCAVRTSFLNATCLIRTGAEAPCGRQLRGRPLHGQMGGKTGAFPCTNGKSWPRTTSPGGGAG